MRPEKWSWIGTNDFRYLNHSVTNHLLAVVDEHLAKINDGIIHCNIVDIVSCKTSAYAVSKSP